MEENDSVLSNQEANPDTPTASWPEEETSNALAPAVPRSWAMQREALEAAAIVAGLVGVPVLIAVGAVMTLFVLTSAVLFAPLVAVGLTWIAWRHSRNTASDPAATT